MDKEGRERVISQSGIVIKMKLFHTFSTLFLEKLYQSFSQTDTLSHAVKICLRRDDSAKQNKKKMKAQHFNVCENLL